MSNAIRANIFNVDVWKPALAEAGVIPMRKQSERWKASCKGGFHVLRHTYASVILEGGNPSSPLSGGSGTPARPSWRFAAQSIAHSLCRSKGFERCPWRPCSLPPSPAYGRS